MSDYVTIDQLRQQAEKDVEVNGRRYRIRRLSPADYLELSGSLPVLPEEKPEDGKRVRVREPKVGEEGIATAIELLARALVQPQLTKEQLYLLPPDDVKPLLEAIAELSGANRPFPPGEQPGG